LVAARLLLYVLQHLYYGLYTLRFCAARLPLRVTLVPHSPHGPFPLLRFGLHVYSARDPTTTPFHPTPRYHIPSATLWVSAIPTPLCLVNTHTRATGVLRMQRAARTRWLRAAGGRRWAGGAAARQAAPGPNSWMRRRAGSGLRLSPWRGGFAASRGQSGSVAGWRHAAGHLQPLAARARSAARATAHYLWFVLLPYYLACAQTPHHAALAGQRSGHLPCCEQRSPRGNFSTLRLAGLRHTFSSRTTFTSGPLLIC